MSTGAASAVGARRHNEDDVTMTIAGLWRYGDWRHVATGCTALVTFKRRRSRSVKDHEETTLERFTLETARGIVLASEL